MGDKRLASSSAIGADPDVLPVAGVQRLVSDPWRSASADCLDMSSCTLQGLPRERDYPGDAAGECRAVQLSWPDQRTKIVAGKAAELSA